MLSKKKTLNFFKKQNQQLKGLNNKLCMSCEQSSVWSHVEELPPDAIFLTKTLFNKDPNPAKVNLGIGAYRTEEGNPYILKVVRKVEREILDDVKLDKEYAPICGEPQYVHACQSVIFGKDAPVLKEKRAAGAQSLSGTGALRVLCEFLKVNFANSKVYLSKPTWGNHTKILLKSHLEEGTYRYWNAKGRNLDIDGMLEDLSKARPGDIVLLHACAHNPTGVDPTLDQWKQIASLLKKNKLIPFFDTAYQGFATGDLDRDAAAIRLFEKEGFDFVVSQSFAKNMGLYSERAGCATVVSQDPKLVSACQSQLEAVIRPMYSNPPRYGAEIVKRVISSPENFKLWKEEMTYMSGRIIKMRQLLRQHLEALKTPGTWNHITDQIGMFSFTGLTGIKINTSSFFFNTASQVDVMISKHHIYMLKNGRISMAGVTTKNVEYLARAMDDVVKNVK
ncbi:aminotransferase, classes I and II family protein [Reticulomyxa filosa]|uniref:Aminotransferase, classes I and II family protein n=1 Tax=Reticulomyxa filosa TaxID=46433 RepID=X6M286_RETFI|nr:aminotransferase, classes I and II family protein [Reticulomyxa filosa]|eukprot:ETO07522.1 aminotransferase, classes I and II family protein [Reticulomyxa filosa]